jgi:hypothetical protein
MSQVPGNEGGRTLPMVRTLVRWISPTLYQWISYRRNEKQVERVRGKILGRYGPTVLSGPFRGMTYVKHAVGSAFCPKILGCYERELHPFIEEFIQRSYGQIVDIGAAEGYYAAGLALRLPNTSVVAFDVNNEARQLCAELAALNKVSDRVMIEGTCTVESLGKVLREGSLIVCDCEGCETDILDPVSLPVLRTCDMIVETHDFVRSDSSELIERRFSPTHSVEWVSAMPRNPGDYPQLDFLGSNEARAIALNEMRPEEQRWAILQSRQHIHSVLAKEL